MTAATVLIVGPDPAVLRVLADALAPSAQSVHVAAGATPARTAAGAAAVDAVCIDLALDPPAATAAAALAAQHGAALLGFAARWDETAYGRALELGCRGLLGPQLDAAEAGAALHAALARRAPTERARDDLQRLKCQYEELRRQCVQQAQRFEQSQENFFLDISRMMTIISNIMDGIVYADRDGRVTLINPVAEDLLGIKAFLAIGKPLADLAGRAELLQVLVADHARMGEHKECAQTIEVHHSEQDLLYIRVLTSRVLDYRGQSAGVLTVLKDITAEYKSDQLKNQYLSIVAHELRTPLTGIKTFSTMMAKGVLGELPERQQRVIESIREQSLRLEHQIDKLINLGHLESNDYGQDREVISVQDFAAGLIAPFEQPAKDRGIALTFACEAPPEAVLWMDRTDLRRASQALIENAVKFTPDHGSVAVRIATQDGQLRLTVTDSGIGIDPRYHRRIFEKFFQVEDPLTRHHGGAGLGLFVAKGIVEAHGSRIEVQSRLGQGAEFAFALPLYSRSTPAGAAPSTISARSA